VLFKKRIKMKKVIAVIALLCLMIPFAANADKKGDIYFETTTHDFGTIKEKGGAVSCEFTFVNKGDGNLSITDAKAQCGCTRPEYPQAPIAPGKKGKIKVTFNPLSRPGAFTKTVTLYLFNCKKKKVVLKIKGTVQPAK
jgi:hypothetical protein